MKNLSFCVFFTWVICGWTQGVAYALGDLGAPILVQGMTKSKVGKMRTKRGPPPISIAYNNASAMQRDNQGTLHILWVDDGDLLYGKIATGSEFTYRRLKRGVQRLPVLGVDGTGGVVVVYRTKTGLFGLVSADAGESFGKVTQLSENNVFAPTLRVWSNGTNQKPSGVVAWHSGTKSVDTTVYASNLVKGIFQGQTELGTDGTESEFVTIGGHKDSSIMVWRDNREGGRKWRLYMSQQDSANGTWTAAKKIGEGMDPSVCVTSRGEIHLVFQDRMQVFYRRSPDNGKTWLDAVRLGYGLFAKVSCNDLGGVGIAWEEMRYRTKADVGTLAKNNKAKTVGLATSTDHGRNISTIVPFDRKSLIFAQVEVSRQAQTLDLLFVDEADMTLRVHSTDL